MVDQTCLLSIPNCSVINKVTLQCDKCNEQYEMKDGKCVLIIKCKDDEYKDGNGNCIKGNFPNCATYNSFGLCLRCKSNYVFNYGLTACQPPVGSKSVVCPPNEDPKMVNVFVEGACYGIDKNCKDGKYSSAGCYECK